MSSHSGGSRIVSEKELEEIVNNFDGELSGSEDGKSEWFLEFV